MQIKRHTQQIHYITQGSDGVDIVVSYNPVVSMVRMADDENARQGAEDAAYLYVTDIPKLIELLQAAYDNHK